MEVIFKEKDWCFCEYKLQQIKEIKEGRITEVTDGNFSHSGYDLSDRCYPIDLSVKRISDTVSFYMDELHKVKSLNLNYPDLNREFVRRWAELCDIRNDEEKLKAGFKGISSFYQSIIEMVNSIKYSSIEGVNIFR